MTPNLELLHAIGQLPLADLDVLPLPDMERMLQRVEAMKSTLRHYDLVLQSALNRRFGDQAQSLRQAAGKQTGTVRLVEAGFEIVADLPKRVEYDQARLQDAVDTLRGWGEKPEDYVSFEIKVAEARYNAWPPAIRKLFEPARTLKTGKPSYKLVPIDQGELPKSPNDRQHGEVR